MDYMRWIIAIILLACIASAVNVTIISPGNTTYGSGHILVNLTNSSDAESLWFFNGTGNQSYTGPVYVDYWAGHHTLTAYVNDSFGTENSSDVSFSVTGLTNYEPNDDAGEAKWISVKGKRQLHAIHPSGDNDWMKFNATNGSKYLIKTSNLTGGTDTIMYLYDTDGNTLIGYNDDTSANVDIASSIMFVPDSNGTYYVRVRNYYSGFSGGFYEIAVTEMGRLHPYLRSPTSNISVDQYSLFNFSAGVRCVGGPCYNVTGILDPKEEDNVGKMVLDEINETGYADVIVKLKGKKNKAEDVLSGLSLSQSDELKDKDFRLKNKYTIYNGFSGKISKKGLEKLKKDQMVEKIYYDYPVYASLDYSVPLIRANDTHAIQVEGINITGEGETVCVVDTGVNYNHPDFAGGVYVGGYDFVNHDSNPMDDHGHGSHVAGIIASQDSTYGGVAPGAKIAAVKVLNSGGSGSTSNVIAGIEWCTDNAETYNISVISMSLGSQIRHSMPCTEDLRADAISAAIAKNITVVIASGNDYWGNGANPPGVETGACVPGAISVGATTKSDNFADYGNRVLMLTIVAPGSSIMSTDYDGTHRTMTGTSMATPHVSGVIALMQQATKLKYNRTLTVEQVTNQLVYNGVPLKDTGGTELTYTRADAYDAVNAKGVVPMNSGEPFYTITQNPSNSFNLADGETMNLTWEVNATIYGGSHEFFVAFEDNVSDGNATPSVYVFVNKTEGPAITIVSPANKSYNDNSILVNISAADPVGVDQIWFFNGTDNQSYTSPVYVDYPEGSSTLIAYANDTGGHESETNVTFSIDSVPPVITDIFNKTILVGTPLGMQFNATDAKGISGWSVNDTNFTINSTGFLENATELEAGFYWLNITVNDTANNTASETIWVNATTGPVIHSYSIDPVLAANGSEVLLYINASSIESIWAEITRPSSDVETTPLANDANTSYTNTSLPGRYNVTFYANDSMGFMRNETGYFEMYSLVIFKTEVIDEDSEGVSSNFSTYFMDELFSNDSSTDGNYSVQLPDSVLDLEFTAFGGQLRIIMRGVTVSPENNKTLGMSRSVSDSGLSVTYGIDNYYTFSNATIIAHYDDVGYTEESNMRFYRCNNWNFTEQACSGFWNEITDDSTQNSAEDYFSYLTTSFSGFSLIYIPVCGDSLCEGDESCSTCPDDCGSCGGGGSSGGGGGGGSSGGSSGGGGGGGGGGGSGGSRGPERNTTLLHIVPMIEVFCFQDSDCESDEACFAGFCSKITGICGYAANHTWNYYECGDSEGCRECPQGYSCNDGFCMVEKIEDSDALAATETEEEPDWVPEKVQECCLFGNCSVMGVEKILGVCHYVWLFVIMIAAVVIAVAHEMPKGKLKKILPLMLLLVTIVQSSDYVHPLYSSYYIYGQENVTTFTFRVYNNYTTPTESFRFMVESDLPWFTPYSFDYALYPDGFDEGMPYWDIPPLYPNETAEVSFTVDGSVALIERMETRTEPLDKWMDPCELEPYNWSRKSENKVYGFLESLNKTQGITGYYETANISLVYLHDYGTFAVFDISDNVSIVENESIVSEIVSDYIGKATPESSADVSKPYEMLKYSRNLKAGPEKSCLVITGMDRFPCVDRETCLYACFSVPVCSFVGQSGWPFMDTLLDYKNNLDRTNELMDSTIETAGEFAGNPSYESAEKTFDAMVELNRAETVMIFHPLFTSYGFCQPPEYGLPEQMEGRRQLLEYLGTTCAYGEKERLVNESMHAASKISLPPELPEPIEVNITNTTVVNETAEIDEIPEEPEDECCLLGVCSLGGMERIGGLCWEWPTIMLLFVFSLAAILLK